MPEFELESGEHVVLAARKHWFLFAATLLPYAILAVIPFALPGLLRLSVPTAPYAAYIDFSQPLMRAALGVWLLVVWTGAWGAFTRYYLNVWVLTNQRIVDIRQPAWFYRTVSSLLLNRVQDVTTNVDGALSSALGIGNIIVQSAGAVDEFRMNGIPHPEVMRDVIMKYVGEKAGPNTSV
jgi:hypothetical protein